MDSRRKLAGAIHHARRRLMMEWLARTAVRGLAAGAVSAVAVLAVSRWFVWPGYLGFAAMATAWGVVVWFLLVWKSAPSRMEAVRGLDACCRDNVILAAETDEHRDGPLSVALADAGAEASTEALAIFRRRKGRWTEREPLLITGLAAAAAVLLLLFPSTAQFEAHEAEEERRITEELTEKVSDLAEQALDPQIGRQLERLADEIEEAASPEEAVRSTVKLQRELSLEERFSSRPEGDSSQTATDPNTLTASEAAAALATLSGDADERLARMGRVSDAGGQTASGDDGDQASDGSPTQHGGSSGGEVTSGDSTSGSGPGSQEQDSENDASEGSGEAGQSGEGDGTAGGSGDEGSGKGETGSGDGEGEGGSGADSGLESSENRELVSTPQRLPETGDPVLDPGLQKEGGSAVDSLVPAEKGDARPYEEVMGEYRDAYVEHAGRLGLPEDLQQVLSDYFSSIDVRE